MKFDYNSHETVFVFKVQAGFEIMPSGETKCGHGKSVTPPR
jgi:hypothetical protein